MSNLRKRLGDVRHSTTIALTRLVETQRKPTLARWATTKTAARHYLPIQDNTPDPAPSRGIGICLSLT